MREMENNYCNINLIDVLFSWSFDDIFNQEFYKVEIIPQTFKSLHHYFGTFISPLLEELRTELSSALETISREPFADVISLEKSESNSALTWNVVFEHWRRIPNNHAKQPYAPLPGDVLLFTQAKCETVEDLQTSGRRWAFGYVLKRTEEAEPITNVTKYEVKLPNGFKLEDDTCKFFYASFLINTSTFKRIWNALSNLKTSEVLEKVLCTDSEVGKTCNMCSRKKMQVLEANKKLISKLNESQYKAVATCLCKLECTDRPNLELIWGPPGTGKTQTLAVLLVLLSELKCRTLICAPTDLEIAEVGSRLVAVLRESTGKDPLCCPFSDIILFGSSDGLKVNLDIEEVLLNYRVKKLVECFGSSSAGWRSCFRRMMQFMEDFDSFSEASRDNEEIDFLDSVREEFNRLAISLEKCVSTICSHLPSRCISEQFFVKKLQLIELLDSFGACLNQGKGVSTLNEFSLQSEVSCASKFSSDNSTLKYMRTECLCALRALQVSLNEVNIPKEGSIRDFCLQNASLVLCTASTSYKLQKTKVEPFRVLIIDNAAQLKECESIVPLQVPNIRHVILIGDDRQLPALVRSKVSEEAMFGRSLFERLSLRGHAKRLLNVQYQMHPLISSFPNTEFYDNHIIDALEVKCKSYRKCYIPGLVFGPLSFINISVGKEVRDEQGSWKNLVEVAVVSKIVQLLHRACIASKCKTSVGIVAPYSAQITELRRKIGKKYENFNNFRVKIHSMDECRGSKEDVVIMSTVRCSNIGSFGFLCDPRRINTSMTMARHCLWVLGDERTLRKKRIWDEFISDAKARMCYFNADENKDFESVIWNVKKELDQLDDFLVGDSMLFKTATWKVLFSDNFKKSFAKLKSVEMKNLVLFLLTKLSSGWRPKRSQVNISCERSSDILKSYMVKDVFLVCSVEVEMVEDVWAQILKVWDVLRFEEIPELVKHLDGILEMYTDDYIECCKLTCVEGDLEVPVTWDPSFEMTRYKSMSKNVMVDNDLLLMKFYSLSCGTVNYLLSGCDGEELSLPFELTNEQKKIVLFDRSTFIVSRSGTGKTSVLTTKLVRNEQLYHISSQGFHKIEKTICKAVVSDDEVSATNRAVLHQLFVTVSPKLCYAVKQELLRLQRFLYSEKSSSKTNSIRDDEIIESTQFADIPDSLVDLSPDSYPLVITFHKFLMMLDGTIGSTFFGRFPEARHLCDGKTGNLRSVSLQAFIQRKEVKYEKFVAAYWPHFNTNHTRKLDVNVVFTEIMSVIKGGLKARQTCNSLLSQTEYVGLHECRGSIFCEKKRETIYDIFLQYEKLKLASGEFDLADLVIDLHRRFEEEKYKGELMDFVYIDEVQDLSISQIALFQYISRNVNEGFVFSGDTAQTIARGINFRFEDIRCLFYEQFVSIPTSSKTYQKDTKGQVSKIFNLRENFRTHAGVLKLAQSVIELIYYFFPFSIDKLGPETSPINGETPVVLGSKENMNIITVIFGESDKYEKIDGFGAEQVILVRDDYSKKELVECIGHRALVLTIMECKGLEFQDVLLYNFFSTSPMEDQWAIIYGYMEENNLFKLSSPTYFPAFNEEKHNVMCSELKQLYVAVTRTRHRLWICDKSGLNAPILSYWKSLGVVQERTINSLFVNLMLVVSSSKDWKARGMKLFNENNFESAIICFERAGDVYWSKYAKAAQLRAASAYMCGPESNDVLREAAEIFESIGNAEQAAQCFIETHDFKRAGTIYLEKCGELKLECAGDCFFLARCYKTAAEVYSKASLFSKCLSSCIDGNLFDMGVQLVEKWKQDAGATKQKELQNIEQDYLQKVALHFHSLENIFSMLKYVRLFRSTDLICSFLRRLRFFDEIHLLEEERSDNFIRAASIAKKKGYYIVEIDLFEKAGLLREVSMLILWYVFNESVPDQTKKRKIQSSEKNDFLNKAKAIASNISEEFHEFVCMESNILSMHKYYEKLFDMELQFIQRWKLSAPEDVQRDYEIEKAEKDLIERFVRHYYNLKDCQAMMTNVKIFYSIDVIRAFLKSLGLLKELLWLEKNLGHLVEAAEVADQIGNYEEASQLVLNYVCGQSLWGFQGKGWPLKHFAEKEKYLARAKSFVYNLRAYDHVFVEADILANRDWNFSVLRKHFDSAQKQESLWSEILSAWKILDYHLSSIPSQLEYNIVNDLKTQFTFMLSKSQISADTMVYFWNHWKQQIGFILYYLSGGGPNIISQQNKLEEFCINYMGVYKICEKQRSIYVLLHSNAEWIRLLDCKFIEKNGKVGYISAFDFKTAALEHLSRVLFSMGIDVLKILKALKSYSVKTLSSVFVQSMLVAHIFEVSNFLKHYTFHHPVNYEFVNECLSLSIREFILALFPIEWRKTFAMSFSVLRGGEVANSLTHEDVIEEIHTRSKLTYEQIGKMLMMSLCSYGIFNESFLQYASYFKETSTWTSFINEFWGYKFSSDAILVPETGNFYPRDVLVVHKFYKALKATFSTNWKLERDYITPSCFLYLIERLLFLVSYFNGYFFTTRESFVEWLIFSEWKSISNLVNPMKLLEDLEKILHFMVDVVLELLLNERDTKEWIRSSQDRNVEEIFHYLVLRLIVHLCLLCLNFGKHFDVLCALFKKTELSSQLPRPFCYAIFRQDCYFVDALADALEKIGNPLLVVGVGDSFMKFSCFSAIFVNLSVEKCKKDLVKKLFHNENDTNYLHSGAEEFGTEYIHPCYTLFWEGFDLLKLGKKLFHDENDTNYLHSGAEEFGTKYIHPCYTLFWEGFDLLELEHHGDGNESHIISLGPKLKVEAEKSCELLSAALDFFPNDSFGDNAKLVAEAKNLLRDLMELPSLLNVREELKGNTSKIRLVLKRVQLVRPRLEPFLNNLLQKYAYDQ